ncbi:MAG: anthranilate phosphoribosyltransferase [Candidatus Omnitrophica bacterium]|nr:anthranilate phosphoribosyltransferase [Candidatus Omnitrophota bacterium]
MIREMIEKVVKREDLTEEEAIQVMQEIMEDRATPAQIASFITALRMKGETIEEITGFAKVMRQKATKIKIEKENIVVDIDREDINIDYETIIDTCGTGGDGAKTFNVSTATAFVVAGAGFLVAKHGNRSVSSECGSADVVKALGINIDIPVEKVKECIERIGIGFLYAPLYHPAMKYALGPRREIGIRTIFNILGPLTNPAGANVQVLGVYNPDLTERLASVLRNLGTRSAMVIYGEGSIDEISIIGRTRISHLKEGKINTYYVQPEDFGLKRAILEDIRGGDALRNAQIILDILNGKDKGPKREMVLLNAAACFIVADRTRDFKEGIEIAERTIDAKRALKKLEDLIKFTNQ